jgi:hypothetical protein
VAVQSGKIRGVGSKVGDDVGCDDGDVVVGLKDGIAVEGLSSLRYSPTPFESPTMVWSVSLLRIERLVPSGTLKLATRKGSEEPDAYEKYDDPCPVTTKLISTDVVDCDSTSLLSSL